MPRLILSLVMLLLVPAASAAAQARLRGFISLDKRIAMGGDSVVVADFYNRFRLEVTAPLGEKLYLATGLDARFYDVLRPGSLRDLEDPEQLFPLDLTLWEAYADLYGFLFEDLDLRVGKQRIAWGRADRLNPTDNLNPDDFSDLVAFGEKIPTWAVKGTYYLGTVQLTGVWMPVLTPVLLPRGGTRLFLGDLAGRARDTLALPDPAPGHGMAALKLGGMLGRWDYSISYFAGYDDIPTLRRITLGDGSASLVVPSELDLGFPRMHVLGADVATELKGIGLWGEAGVFRPEQVEVITRTRAGGLVDEQVILDDEPYLKFTLGGDYTFSNNLYVNVQWMHGFFTERGTGALHDYVFAQLEKDVLQDDLKLTLGGAIEVGAWKAVADSYGYGLFPELTYQAVDNLELTLGAFLVDGRDASLFGTWREVDQLYLRLKVQF